MPAVSTKQRQLMAIAEHTPSKVQKQNRGVLKMSKSQLHDFASTKGLSQKKQPPKGNLSNLHKTAVKNAMAKRGK